MAWLSIIRKSTATDLLNLNAAPVSVIDGGGFDITCLLFTLREQSDFSMFFLFHKVVALVIYVVYNASW